MRKEFTRCLVMPVVLLALTAASVRANAQEKTVLQFPLEYVWRKIYQMQAGVKAMAIADNGAYGISYNYTEPAKAESGALETCTERSKFISLREKAVPACRLLTVQSEWKEPSLQPDPEWQQPLQGKDTPMRKGRTYRVGKNAKGIILHVHGCDGLGAKVFSDVWASYFNALGYDFYAPDSFAVKRPKPVCGRSYDFPAQQLSDVWRLRVAQTQRTLADLRKANPDKPIYLWGHSEGGLIVQLVEAPVAGIIVSGEECGALQAAPAAPTTVPFLYLWGEYDQYVNGLGLFKVDAASIGNCKQRMPGFKFDHVILEGRGHNPFPWNKKINEAVARFLNSGPLQVATVPKTKKMSSNWKRIKPDKRYRQSAPHRAAAMNNAGTSSMVWGLDVEEDARQLALFGCARNTSRKTNLFKSGKHICAVVDVNGAVSD